MSNNDPASQVSDTIIEHPQNEDQEEAGDEEDESNNANINEPNSSTTVFQNDIITAANKTQIPPSNNVQSDRSQSSIYSNYQHHQAPLTEKIGSLFESDIFADVTFNVGEGSSSKRFRAHKLILAISSPVFSAMFYGTIKCEDNIKITDCRPEAFRILLQFAYKNELSVGEVQLALDALYAARKYSMRRLEDACMVYLCSHVAFDSVLPVKEAAEKYQLPNLESICKEYIEEYSYDVLKYNHPYLNMESLLGFIQNDRLNIREVELFHILLDWADQECARLNKPVNRDSKREILEPLLPHVRFPTMTAPEFADQVVPLDILNVQEIAQILTYISATDKSLITPLILFPTAKRTLRPILAAAVSSSLLPNGSSSKIGKPRGFHRSKKRSRNR